MRHVTQFRDRSATRLGLLRGVARWYSDGYVRGVRAVVRDTLCLLGCSDTADAERAALGAATGGATGGAGFGTARPEATIFTFV